MFDVPTITAVEKMTTQIEVVRGRKDPVDDIGPCKVASCEMLCAAPEPDPA